MANTRKSDVQVGTKDWQSYAYFRAGVEWQSRDERDSARRMFLKALDRDPDNPAALFNLASLNVYAGDYDFALPRLKKAIEGADRTSEDDALWYKAVYQLAATYAYKGCLSDAETEADRLVRRIDCVLNSRDHKDQVHDSEYMKEVLKPIQPIAEILYAGIVMSKDDSPHKEVAQRMVSRLESDDRLPELSYRVRYNLACYYSRAGGRTHNKKCKCDAYNKALSHLEYALERGGSLVQWACKDPGLKCVPSIQPER